MLTDTSSNFVRSGSVTHADVSKMHVSMLHVSMMVLSMIYVTMMLLSQFFKKSLIFYLFSISWKGIQPRTTDTNQPTFSLIHFSGRGHNMFRVQNGPVFWPKVWVVGYKLQPYWRTGELGWRSDWELKVNVVEHTGNQRQVTGVRVGLVIDSGSVLAPCILLWPDSKANIIAQSIPPFCISFINKNTNNAGIANAV